MKFDKIHIEFSKLFSHIIWGYLTLVALHHFHQPLILSAEAASISTSQPTLSQKTPTLPTVPYIRKSRDTSEVSATSAPEFIDGQDQSHSLPSGGHFFAYPSYKHKHQQQRIARFHGESSRPATRTYSIRSMTSFPKLNPLAGILSMKSSEVRYPSPEELDNEQDPTFTPYISARALSNIPQFFQHLRDNLEALQLDEDEMGGENGESFNTEKLLGQSADTLFPYGSDDGPTINIPHQPERQPMRWMPATAGMTGRAHIRHFINDPAELDPFYKKPAYNPGRNPYEFGLG